MHKLIDVTDNRVRRLQMGGAMTSTVLMTGAMAALVLSAVPVWLGVLSLLLGLAFLIVVAGFRQRWQFQYKGHEVRFENSPFTGERLYLDGGLVARGGIGLKMEIRAPIRVGEGQGEELMALVDAGLFRFRLRVYVEGGTHDSPSTTAPSVSAPVVHASAANASGAQDPGLSVVETGALGRVLVAKHVLEAIASLITVIGGLWAIALWWLM